MYLNDTSVEIVNGTVSKQLHFYSFEVFLVYFVVVSIFVMGAIAMLVEMCLCIFKCCFEKPKLQKEMGSSIVVYKKM